jgi:hypothetical protein
VNQRVDENLLEAVHVRSEDNTCDILTKNVISAIHWRHTKAIHNGMLHWSVPDSNTVAVEIIGYVGSIGLEALCKPPERISDAVRFWWDRNSLRTQPVSTSGTHIGYSNNVLRLQLSVPWDLPSFLILSSFVSAVL